MHKTDFDRDVWEKIGKARGLLESAMLAAREIGYFRLFEEIDAARDPLLLLLSKCHDISVARASRNQQ